MISVVVPAYNAEKTLSACLEALLDQTAPREAYEIIVVDDGSTDRTRQIAEAYGVCVVAEANQGAASARNLGAQNARGDIVLFIDADSVPDKKWIQAMAAPFTDPTIAGASGQKKTRQQNIWARLVQLEYDFKYDRMSAHTAIDFVDSSTAAYRREVLLDNGGFDSTLMEAEDTELSYRLSERGYRLVLIREAVTYHTHPESLSHYLRRKFQYARWRAVVYKRYPHKAASDQRTPPAQKIQPLIAFALVPIVAAAVIWNLLVWGIALLALLFLLTTLPFVMYCWRRSVVVALVVPPTVLLSAYASGAGAALGFLQRPVDARLLDSTIS
jgi:cellulose synthase/poly-beta-1,6-N-acetylglucosamine synthase-like glycosyltransferase